MYDVTLLVPFEVPSGVFTARVGCDIHVSGLN